MIGIETLRPSRRLRSSTLWVLLGFVVLCGACTSDEETTSAEPAAEFAADLQETADALEPGESIALSEMTGFEWDDVYFFGPGTKRSAINDSVGFAVYDVDLDERVGLFNDGFLAVFTRDGSLVDTAIVPSYFAVLDERLEQSSATVAKSTSATGGEQITITNQAS